MFIPLANHFLRRLQLAIEEIRSLSAPAVDLKLSSVESAPYPLLAIEESERDARRFPCTETLSEQLGSQEDFYEKQDRLRAISEEFFDRLKGLNAQLFTELVTIDDLRVLALAVPTMLPNMLDMLEQANDTELCWLKNLAFVVANLVSNDMPERAVTLFQRALQTQGFVTYELADGLTLEHEAIWSSSPSLAVNLFWRERLLTAGDDEILAREVTAAERFGAARFIKAFVQEQANSPSALDQSFAISVAGFSRQSEECLDVIESHLDDKGITGDAAKKARAAHETAQWAEKWTREMYLATSPEKFWRCLIISKACMDMRVSDAPIRHTRWAHFAALFKQVRKAAIREQSKNRKKTFVGQSVPDLIFVTGYVS